MIFYVWLHHIYQMAKSDMEGIHEEAGIEAELRRVTETLSDKMLSKMGTIEAQKAFSDVQG